MKPLLVVAAVLAAVAGVLVVQRYQSTYDVAAYDLAVRSLEENQAAARRIGATAVTLPSGLRALVRPPTEGATWLLYWGGNTDRYFEESADTLAALRLPRQLGLCVVAPPGYDGSPGHPSPEVIDAQAREARDWLLATQGAQHLLLGGFSLGTLSVLAAADERALAGVLLAAPTRFLAHDPAPLFRLRAPDEYLPAWRPLPMPVLVVHGQADDGFPVAMGQTVASTLGARWLAVPDAGHVDLQTNPTALKAVRRFILDRSGLVPE